MKAALNMEKVPLLEPPDAERKRKTAYARRKVRSFARSVAVIEELRGEQRELLRKSLNVERLPRAIGICDPFLLPLLSEKIQIACKSFPGRAEAIARKHGLEGGDFDKLLRETRRNPLMRWRINRYMRRWKDRNSATLGEV